MSKDLRTLLVVDVEATCWESEKDRDNPLYRGDSLRPTDQETEIIEIGVCELDLRTFERRNKTSILINPVRSKVSPFCTRLTTLTQEDLERHGKDYKGAVAQLNEQFKPRHRPWASWGSYDLEMFRLEGERRANGAVDTIERRKAEPYKELPVELFPWSRLHTNAKHQLSLLMGRFDGEFGMAHACALAGIPLEGTHHRGHDDAYNIAGIIGWMLQRARPMFGDVLSHWQKERDAGR